jgi:glycosyltransferase involved in cell wall biosynthesis
MRMRLVFITQVLDARDAVLGFVPRWVSGLAARCERVRVLALEVGDASGLPGNVDLRSIGRRGRLGRYLRFRGFLKEALQRDGFDAVLAHMVPRYALLARGPARAAGAGLHLWYTHGQVDGRLRRAVRAVDRVFTASPESMRVETDKRVVTGHGIDLAHFSARGIEPDGPPRVLAVGRMTPAKDPLTLLAAAAILVARGFDLHVDLAGPTLAAGDATYLRRVEEQIELGGLAGRVVLHGAVPYGEIPALYRRARVLVNPSRTGSIDKVVLEAMACERPVLTCNEAFPPLFAELGADAALLCFGAGSAQDLALKLARLLALPTAERRALGSRLRALVARDHEVDALMGRLVSAMEGVA